MVDKDRMSGLVEDHVYVPGPQGSVGCWHTDKRCGRAPGEHAPGSGHLLRAIADVCAEAALPNWDGYDAFPYWLASRAAAEAFVLEWNGPIPHVGVTPHGDLTLEWTKGRDSSLFLSFSANGLPYYAWRHHDRSGHGRGDYAQAAKEWPGLACADDQGDG